MLQQVHCMDYSKSTENNFDISNIERANTGPSKMIGNIASSFAQTHNKKPQGRVPSVGNSLVSIPEISRRQQLLVQQERLNKLHLELPTQDSHDMLSTCASNYSCKHLGNY